MAGPDLGPEIGRASCRERVEISVVAVSLKKKSTESGGRKCANLVHGRRLWAMRRQAAFMVRRPASLFFQAEDGIRDGRVTGVQTCALPISAAGHDHPLAARRAGLREVAHGRPGPRT